MTMSTPIVTDSPHPLTRPLYPSHTAPAPKRLRSCLSPTRLSRSSSPVEDLSMIQLASNSSDGWRRVKSVRWEGEDETDDEGSVVKSYHLTWSATEYDRTPLDPPSAAERLCVLPERNSRCLRTSLESFDTILSCLEAEEEAGADEMFHRTLLPPAIQEDKDRENEEQNEDEDCGDAEWEECMERRRMMFAHMCRSSEGDERYPEFDGYRSISSTLVELLRQGGEYEGIVHAEPEEMESGWHGLDESDETAQTPSLVWSSGSEMGCSSAGPPSPSPTVVGPEHVSDMMIPLTKGTEAEGGVKPLMAGMEVEVEVVTPSKV
ncbi:hypothetical protein BCR39DRAFT_505396 [Naematelia encephala]|uniref:Uncharacterized protein n=1 Tax=Naematelia encephala TaxID=71784 RepID=A0A1Y2B4Q7_9TREE|nr:hypothetical protein BCR39DRAFT_505396 [Naematelia encephala]